MSTPDLPDQQPLWVSAYETRAGLSNQPSAFLTEVLATMPAGSRVLELGCGPGIDAAALAEAGHAVTAMDFAPNVIARNQAQYAAQANLHFIEGRIDAPYPFPDHAFDAVYAHLTLHYYRDADTRAIIAEIRRVLAPGGWLLFACKAPGDPAHGRGVEIEPNLFDLNGKVRHFFTPEYAESLLSSGFTDIRVAPHTGKLYGHGSAWITAIARAT